MRNRHFAIRCRYPEKLFLAFKFLFPCILSVQGRETETHREVISTLALSLNAYNSQDKANSGLLHAWNRSKYLDPPRVHMIRKLNSKTELGIEPRCSDRAYLRRLECSAKYIRPRQYLKQYVKSSFPTADFFN